jgi:pimeloyl-ACP methyl ester carboxylesterase
VKMINAGVLAMSYLEDGSPEGWPVILSHGFPFDVHAYDKVVPLLTIQGARVIRPYLRGYGPTRFLSATRYAAGNRRPSVPIWSRFSAPRASRPRSSPDTTGAAWPPVLPPPCGPSARRAWCRWQATTSSTSKG